MRNIERLDSFYDTLKKAHKHFFPDWRFAQLVTNIQNWYIRKYGIDIFYLEEDQFIEVLNDYIKEVIL